MNFEDFSIGDWFFRPYKDNAIVCIKISSIRYIAIYKTSLNKYYFKLLDIDNLAHDNSYQFYTKEINCDEINQNILYKNLDSILDIDNKICIYHKGQCFIIYSDNFIDLGIIMHINFLDYNFNPLLLCHKIIYYPEA